MAAEPLANAESAAPASISTPKAATAPVAADSPLIFASLNGMGSWFSICRLIKIEADQVVAKAEQQSKSRRSGLWLSATDGRIDTDPRLSGSPFSLARALASEAILDRSEAQACWTEFVTHTHDGLINTKREEA